MAKHKRSNVDIGRYAELLASVKARVREARVRTGLAANRELLHLYWDVGQLIVQRQSAEGWGAAVAERLSRDLLREFPGVKGFSPRNIWRMRTFYLAYCERNTNLPQAVAETGEPPLPPLVAEIPWGHNVILLEKVKEAKAREWYIRQTREHGWSRNMLALHIEAGDYERRGKAVTNFSRTLPAPQSDLAQDVLKDPYVFDFLGIADGRPDRTRDRSGGGRLSRQRRGPPGP